MAKLIHTARTTFSNLSAFVRYFLVSLALLMFINAALGGWLYQKLVVDRDQQVLQHASEELVQRNATIMSGRLRQLSSQLQSIAEDGTLQQALASQNLPELDRIRQHHSSDIAGLHSFHIISADASAQPSASFSFAERDMLRRAARAEKVRPEASRADNEWRVSLVQEIAASEAESPGAENADAIQKAASPLGFILLSVGLDHLMPLAPEGSMELLQLLPNEQLQLAVKRGIGADVAKPVEARVAGSVFTLRFTPSDSTTASTRASRLPFMAGLGLSTLLFIGLAYGTARVLSCSASRRSSQHDAEAQDEALEHLLNLDKQRKRRNPAALAASPPPEDDPLDIQDQPATNAFPEHIFRAYDIRGLAHKELTAELVMQIGKAVGSEALINDKHSLIVARDGRLHSADISEQLIAGILSTGCNVSNIGLAPTPLLYFACHELDDLDSGVMVTASHNPSTDNGFKIVLGKEALHGDDINKLRARIEAKDFRQGQGQQDFLSLEDQYIERIFSDLFLSGEPTLVIDAGNGVTGQLAPRLFEALGCRVVPLFCEIDGNFPNHDPDPSVASNLKALVASVQENKADLGLAFDGDGDRVVLVSRSGRIVPPDQLLMMLAKDIVSRNPGADVLFDVKCSRALGSVISAYGGRPLMWKSGHSHMKAKMRETGALLGGEYSGHIFIKERWYGFDDGLYAAARVLEIMSLREQDLDSILESFPVPPSTPEIKIPVPEADKFALVETLIAQGSFGSGRATTIDGLRVDFARGWGLVRASNTSPALTARFEGESKDDLDKIAALFKRELAKIHPDLSLDF